MGESIAAVADAASPGKLASLPFQHVRRDLTAFHDDTERLADFVADQLNVLPGSG